MKSGRRFHFFLAARGRLPLMQAAVSGFLAAGLLGILIPSAPDVHSAHTAGRTSD
jgi:hypothetical protein